MFLEFKFPVTRVAYVTEANITCPRATLCSETQDKVAVEEMSERVQTVNSISVPMRYTPR
jgi:hypothetical protein